ncbi:hypothetical protein BJY52DRAFT_1213422 [Lactarius psammicola]|nr:hypothetical protein BJY52DRAFT_1213422 [Lactarius psammicola]
MRSLSLHDSALNEDEYSLFTSSFINLVASDIPPTTDADFEKQKVSIREARAWLRGRYADPPVSILERILRLFAPDPGQDPELSRGQFFAILRLVLHVRSGAEFDRNLVFKQVWDGNLHAIEADAPTSDTNPFSHANQVYDHPQLPVHSDLRMATVSS